MYDEFVTQELEASDKAQHEGSKIQFAQVFPQFMEHAFRVAGSGSGDNGGSAEESKSQLTPTNNSSNSIALQR